MDEEQVIEAIGYARSIFIAEAKRERKLHGATQLELGDILKYFLRAKQAASAMGMDIPSRVMLRLAEGLVYRELENRTKVRGIIQ